MTKNRFRAYTFLLATMVIWGAASPIIKFTLGGIDPLPFLSYRFLISGILSLVLVILGIIKLPFNKPKDMGLIAVYGLLATTIALGALFTGLDKTTVLDFALIGTLGPLMVALGGEIFFHDRITKREKLGIIIAFTGAALAAVAPAIKNIANAEFTGNVFILIFLLADSGAVLLAKKLSRGHISSFSLANTAFLIGALTLIPLVLITHNSNQLLTSVFQLPLKYHLGVWYMALLSGTLAYFFWIKGQKSIEVSEAALFYYLQPIFSVPLAIFWLHETITPLFIIGAIIIATGVVIAEYKAKLSR